MVTSKTWQARMSEDMRLRDFRPRTQEAYLAATRQFMDHVACEPKAITDGDLRTYFLYLREERKLAPSTINVALNGIRFFVLHTLQRDWAVLDLLRCHKPRILPVVLSRPEVRTLLGAVRHPVRRMALTSLDPRIIHSFSVGENLMVVSSFLAAAKLAELKISELRDRMGALTLSLRKQGGPEALHPSGLIQIAAGDTLTLQCRYDEYLALRAFTGEERPPLSLHGS